MEPHFPAITSGESRNAWIRLHTLIHLRWLAIAGQFAAIAVAYFYFNITLDIGLCFLAIGTAVIANLVAISIFPETRRLSEAEATLALLFDLAQLALLLFLTGGLNNPFALLLLVPVTISATALGRLSTILLGLTTIALVLALGVYHLPLGIEGGGRIEMPRLLEFGYGLSIIIGIVFLGFYAGRISSEIHSMGDALLATQLALAREQKLTDLGGVIAAAAHELGTPLATIKLVSAELVDELQDQPALREDAELIRQQADRCRDILRSMGRAGKDDRQMHKAPIMAVVREAAEPHSTRGKIVHISALPDDPEHQPQILRRPEIIHGLRNLIQNAVDFARSTVWVETDWTDDRIMLRISDDGPGYPANLLGRIGDPFVRNRRTDDARPGYDGMGLGLFIAKTLLERTGAELSFANGSDPFLTEAERPVRCGAVVAVEWPRAAITADTEGPLGENTRILF